MLRYYKDVEIRADTTISATTKQSANRPDIVILDKRKEITTIEIGITCQYQLLIVENEKAKKYDFLANEMEAMHNCKTRIIPYVMTWDGKSNEFLF